MKYVKLQSPDACAPIFIFGVAPTSHDVLAQGFIERGFTAVAAGFYDIRNHSVFGASSSLGLQSDPSDSRLIEMMIRTTLVTAARPAEPTADEVRRFAAGEPRDHTVPHALDANARRRMF